MRYLILMVAVLIALQFVAPTLLAEAEPLGGGPGAFA